MINFKSVYQKPGILLALTVSLGIIGLTVYSFTKKKHIEEQKRRKKIKSQTNVNIGAIFGMDVGGTLTKIVYFEKTPVNIESKSQDPFPSKSYSDDALAQSKSGENDDLNDALKESNLMMRRSISLSQLDRPDHQAALKKLYEYMNNSNTYGKTGIRDDRLSFYSDNLGGRLHFLHFETRNMMDAIKLLNSAAITENIRSIGCTGGGAHKYAQEFSDQLDIDFVQLDELKCLVRGMNYALTNIPNECYTYRLHSEVDLKTSSSPPSSPSSNTPEEKWRKDIKEYTKKVSLPYESYKSNHSFPYLIINIGSGVSILKVTAQNAFERVSGTAIGGGTYWGLCRLLTKCTTYENVLDLAERGVSTEIDMLVKDIYGGAYENLNLSPTMVASCFGKLVMKNEEDVKKVKEEDIAIAILMMITNNIGQVSYLNARLHDCTKIYFVGSFLRHNRISCRRLAFAIDFWSQGSMEALFLEHEGYFGALGTFLQSAVDVN